MDSHQHQLAQFRPLFGLCVVACAALSVAATPAAPTSGPASAPAKSRPFFVGERVPALRHGAKLEWAVIRKIGKHFLYVEWEGWEGFPGDWLPPESLRREDPNIGTPAPPRHASRKPAPIPPEPPPPEPKDANVPAPDTAPSEDPSHARPHPPRSTDGPTEKAIESDLAAAPKLGFDAAHTFPLPSPTGSFLPDGPATWPTAPAGDLTIGAGLEGDAPDGPSLFTSGPNATLAALVRQSKSGGPVVVRADLATGHRIGTSALPRGRSVIGVSQDASTVVTRAGLFGNLVEVWDVSAQAPLKRASFAFADAVLAPRAQWATFAAHDLLVLGTERRDAVFLSIPALSAATTAPSAPFTPHPLFRLTEVSGPIPAVVSPGGKYIALVDYSGNLALLRPDGTTALSGLSFRPNELPAFTPDGALLYAIGGGEILDLRHSTRHELKGALSALLSPDLALTATGDLVRWRSDALLWHFRTGTPRDPKPLAAMLLAGRAWTYSAPDGALISRALDLTPALDMERHPLPDITTPMAGRKVCLRLNLDPADDAPAVRAQLARLIASVGATLLSDDAPPPGSGETLLLVTSKHGSERKTYSKSGLPPLPSHEPNPDSQTVDCPYCRVTLCLQIDATPRWTQTYFAGASGFVQPPKTTPLQDYVNSLFRPAQELLKGASLPPTLPDPATDARITTYLPAP